MNQKGNITYQPIILENAAVVVNFSVQLERAAVLRSGDVQRWCSAVVCSCDLRGVLCDHLRSC